MRHVARSLLLPVVLALATAGTAQGQSAQDVLQHMLDTYVERSEGVEDYTLVQEVMGFESEMYFEKETLDGLPMFRLRQSKVGGRVLTQPDEDDMGWERMYQVMPELMQRAEYVGRADAGGFPVHVVAVRSLHEIDFSPLPESEGSDFVPETMTLHVDADQWIVRRAELSGTMTAEGKQHDFTADVAMTDYREVGGMLHPFLMTVNVQGLAEAMGMDSEKMAELQQQLEAAKKQMEQMPEAQRQTMERMMQQQMANLEQMMEGDGEGGMAIEVRVKDLRVNSGPPEGE
jgi:hypothetical protein